MPGYFISIYPDIKPSKDGYLKNSLSKPFSIGGRIIFSLIAIHSMFVFISPSTANAGFFSSIFRFLVGDSAQDSSNDQKFLSAISIPLMGGQAIPPGAQNGTGGPDGSLGNLVGSTPSVQDSAFVAPRNPAGILSLLQQDEILVYTIQPGDVPGEIAEKFGISLNTLLWANNIQNPNLIKIGDELIILPVSGVRYEVKEGDTPESIAKEFKGDPLEILSFNGLAIGEKLEVGTTIIVPDGEFAPPPSAVVSSPARSFSGLPTYSGYYMRPILGGRKSRGFHGYNAVDLADSCGLPVLASAAGTVIIARNSGWNGGYGKYLVISHPNGTQTLYAHLNSILARVGQYLAQGSQVATIGSTGNSTGCHVHFEIRGARNPF